MRLPTLVCALLLSLVIGCGDSGSSPTAPPPDAPRIMLRDAETGSLWDLRGVAIAGRLQGQSLERYPTAHSAYWFAWASFWPATSVWGQDDPAVPGGLVDFGPIRSKAFIPDKGPDTLPPLEQPLGLFGEARFEPAGAHDVPDEGLVLGLELGTHAFAYPVRILLQHEIAMHPVDGRNLLITFCALTGSGIAFDRGTDWFGNAGGLFNNNLVLYDRQSRSLWSQMGRSSILGARLHEHLSMVPLYQGTWAAWLERHPDTLVLSTDTGYGFLDYDEDGYGARGYYTNDAIWFPQDPEIDPRFHAKQPVLGLIGEDSARAYPFTTLSQQGAVAVVNDVFEAEPVLVTYDDIGRSAQAFHRTVNDRVLTFEVFVEAE